MNQWTASLIQQLDDEGQRSVARRGLVGHYVAGTYRTIARPIATRQIIMRAKIVEFLWGMDAVANMLVTIPERYINAFLRAFGATVAEDAIVGDNLRMATIHVNRFEPLTIGKSVNTGRRLIFDLSAEVTIGDHCGLGNDTAYISHTDFARSPLKAELFPVRSAPIRIGRGAFIGSNTMVNSGVTIGQCAVIGANSVVLSNIPPYCFAAGSPAKVIREFDRSKIPPFNEAEAFIIPEGTTD
ncbi:MAG: acyltransferase [Anaerolineae bacterium]|nr:acyltransferase [Anaerolineae bacterium]